MAEALSSPPVDAVHIGGAVASRRQLATIGYDCPDWASLLEGARPRQPNLDEVDPGVPTHGWQFFAAQAVAQRHRTVVVWPRLSETEQALFRSQSGPMSGLPFSSVPSSPPTRFAPQLFRVLLLRRFWLALSLSLSLLALAGVAVHSASLATTVQRVRERESWGVGGSLWRAQRHGSAVKPELGTPPISSSGIWTFLLPTMTPVVWRSLPDGLPLFGGAQLAIDTR